MSLNSFIPEIWASELLVQLQKALVFAGPNIVNRDYENEINNVGDTVRIHGIGDITVSDYTKNSDLAAPQELTDDETVLTISKAKTFQFAIDDVDAAQQNPKVMAEAMQWAAYRIRDQIDQFIAGLYTDAANAVGSDGSPLTPAVATDANTGTTAFDYLTDLGTKLDESNVPAEQRWAVVPPWFYAMLFKDRRFTNYGTDPNRATLANGLVGNVNGVEIYKSNNVVTSSGTYGAANSVNKILVGHPMAITFANTINKVEAFRSPTRFADVVRGLSLYGAKVVRPYALSVGTFQHP